jgi:hypothetical protein
MIPRFFTDNKNDRIEFVKFIQDNNDIIKKLLDKTKYELEVEGKKIKSDQNVKYSVLNDFSTKKRKFTYIENTYYYFTDDDFNLGDDPLQYELLIALDSDEIHDDGFMENPERKRQIKAFEEWLIKIKDIFAKTKLNKLIKKLHIENLKENLGRLSVRPMGALGENDPGGLLYQKILGKWEGMTMETHDKNIKLG